MAPKQRVVVSSSSVGRRQQDGFLSSAYREVTSAENVTIVRSVIVFGVCIHLSWSYAYAIAADADR
jgi:hypothetical protein